MVAELGFEPRPFSISDCRLCRWATRLWFRRRDSNPYCCGPGPHASCQSWATPECGTDPGDRTRNLQLRGLLLCPVELGQYGGERRSRTPACYRPLVFETSCRPSQQRSPSVEFAEPDDDIVVSLAYRVVRSLAFGADPRSRASDLPGFNRALLPPELGRRGTHPGTRTPHLRVRTALLFRWARWVSVVPLRRVERRHVRV